YLFFLIALTACGDELSNKEKQKVESALSDSLLATTESWDVDMEIITDGLKKVHLTGSYAATYNEEDVNETRIKGPVFIEVFDSSGTVKTTVNADRAVYIRKNRLLNFLGTLM